MKVTQSCPTLWDPVDYTVHEILWARILERVTFPFSSKSSQPRDQTQVFLIASGFFTSWATREAHSPVDLPNPGVQLRSPALLADSLSTELSGKANYLLTNTCRGDLLLREMYESSKYFFFLIFCLWPYFDLRDLIFWENCNFIYAFKFVVIYALCSLALFPTLVSIVYLFFVNYLQFYWSSFLIFGYYYDSLLSFLPSSILLLVSPHLYTMTILIIYIFSSV